MFNIIGEVLLYAVSLPLIGYQTIMGLGGLLEAVAHVSEYARMK